MTEEITPRIYKREEHIISRKNIDPDALKVMRRLMRHGYKAYLVGGGVRDLLLGKKPKDFDIATDATPRRVKSLFRNCRIIGRRFKLAHIYFGNDKIFEVATFRASHDDDFATDESGEVDEKDLILQNDNYYGDECSDALRRDITINALYYSLKNFSVIDYVGGMEDLKAGRVRVIGEPEVRFTEDPVRMIRVVRHAVRAGCTIDEGCIQAIENKHHLLKECPDARLYEELKKDLTSGYMEEILRAYAKHQLLGHLISSLADREETILAPKTLAAKALKRIDAKVLSEGFSNTTIILAIIAYFLATDGALEPRVSDYYSDKEDIADFVRDCFKPLVVPRKDREVITDILDLIRQLEEAEEEGEISGRITKYASFPLTLIALDFLNSDKRVQTLLDLTENIPEEKKKRSSRSRKRRRKTKKTMNN